MTVRELAGRAAPWLSGAGERADLVLSSRVRLARNVGTAPFAHRATEKQKQAVVDEALRASGATGLSWMDASRLSRLHRQLLVERHLISPALAAATGPRGVLVEGDEARSVMVNEEDHLRVQGVRPGFQAREALEAVRRLEEELARALPFARSSRWGYLTACATNAGTGLRASVLIHLPGLALTKEMDGVVRGAGQMGFAVRGLDGEGTEPAGGWVQVSNQMTMGRSEEELVDGLEAVVERLTECEANARDLLLREARSRIEDKVWRARGILRNARLMSFQDLMSLSSALRLGANLGILKGVDTRTLNELMVLVRPSHLEVRAGRPLKAEERDALRAQFVRERMGKDQDPSGT